MGRFFVVLKRPLLAILLMLLLQAAAGLALLIAQLIKGHGITADGTPEQMFDASLMAICLFVADVIISLACLAIFRRKQYSRSQYVPSSSTWKQNLWGMLGCVFGVVALDLMTELMAIPNLMEEQMMAICDTPWGVAAIALAAPVGEEMLFRWGIMGHLLHHNRGVAESIFVSALLFGLIHMNPAQVFFATAMGVLLGMLYWKTGNIFLPVLLHVLNNSVACAQVWLLGDDIHTYSMVEMLGGHAMAWSTVAACAAVCIGLMWWYAMSKPTAQTIGMEDAEA
ncbi:MAG: CPBP family intramembrane metalloprotease [Bacteroides sp.]|nr:CPBP family intramembrane metalloprotease [Bacteroides sp.]MCM1447952.1 CPBP family intramembrane metalloprotease [Bacteroides sp.]MCM1516450.1 CPBP family intramembrane metalloprotease [Paraprevotella sp.]